jgi:hypothetical protein
MYQDSMMVLIVSKDSKTARKPIKFVKNRYRFLTHNNFSIV